MTAYTLRPATADDFAFLFGLHRAAMSQYIETIWGWHDDWQEEYFRRKFNPSTRQIIQVEGRDGGVVVIEQRPDEVYLSLIELLPEYQRRGTGTQIINDLKTAAHNTGKPISLHVLRSNGPARRLYEGLGFQVDAEEEDRLHMTCQPAIKTASQMSGLVRFRTEAQR